MMRRLWAPIAMMLSLVAGTVADRPVERQPVHAGPYLVLSADFHTHPALGSGGSLTPWGLVTEAERQGLDALAVTGHNTTWDARVAHAFSRLASGPIVLVGEEVTSRTQDLVAIGIHDTVSPMLPLRDQIDEVHRQGGLAIAAHPIARYHEAYRTSGALATIDGTEVCHPLVYAMATGAGELAAFASVTAATPIGSSDFHASGRVGTCRTFVFVEAATERGVLEAVRAHRTVVYGTGGRAFGDPALVQLADAAGLRDVAGGYARAHGSVLDLVSSVTAGAALFGLAMVTRSRASHPAAARRESGRPGRAQYP